MYHATERPVMMVPFGGDRSDRNGNGQRLRYLPIGKRRLADLERANARRERGLAILANFLETHRALGLFFKRDAQPVQASLAEFVRHLTLVWQIGDQLPGGPSKASGEQLLATTAYPLTLPQYLDS